MPVLFCLHELENKTLSLRGRLPPEELDLDKADEMIHLPEPLDYEVEVQKTPDGILARGRLQIELECECVRCLEPFRQTIDLPDWACLLPLEGEEKVVVIHDGVDLTPYIREDIVLAFPQHPLCRADCQGLEKLREKATFLPDAPGKSGKTSTPWAELDNLKF